MIDKIEEKIAAHVQTILEKDTISFCEYQILVNELHRLDEKEKAEKWNAESKQRNEKLFAALKDAMN